ncbi:hypothetical protein [Sporosarcina sp. FSL K6-1508]|uniref:hypothetical protein n=1 Tax=Sporosarcina sp. FSL K6-1508 TaxID=2921553 RepID=UPI0030FA827D
MVREIEKILPKYRILYFKSISISGLITAAIMFGKIYLSEILFTVLLLVAFSIANLLIFKGLNFIRIKENIIRLRMAKEILIEQEQIIKEEKRLWIRLLPICYVLLVDQIIIFAWIKNDYDDLIQISLYLFSFLILTLEFFRGFQARAQTKLFFSAIKSAMKE